MTQSSAISASYKTRNSMRAFCLTGTTKLPWPVTIRNWVSCDCRLEPEMSMASLGAGTCQNNMTNHLTCNSSTRAAGPPDSGRQRLDEHRPGGDRVGHDHPGVHRDRPGGPSR